MSSHNHIQESLDLLERDWDIDPTLRSFMLGEITNVSDYTTRVNNVTFHIPCIDTRYVLWKCFWPDCHNCCDRQGRLPLTSDDLITIGNGLGYQKTSDFVRDETIVATYEEPGPSNQNITLTTINLKRRVDETVDDDGTHISCRFLDKDGGCSMHPSRPGVCYLYPFSTWLMNEKGSAKVHATFQFTGDCPGFYLSDTIAPMHDELETYSKIIYEYNMASNRTNRDGFSCTSFN